MLFDSNCDVLVPNSNMSSYVPCTPPSSNEDSPPIYYMNSPSSTSFQGPEAFEQMIEYAPIDINPHIFINQTEMEIEKTDSPTLQFIEQPTDRFRFRYKSEMAGTHGSLTGMNSDRSRKQTFPTVELKNFTGQAIVRCSIYQINAKDEEHMPHAHRLIMKNGKEEQDDPHDMVIGPEHHYKAKFNGMGIIHTAKKNIIGELIKKKTRLKIEEIARREGNVRELNTKEIMEIKGLAEAESKSINLNIVCLRFDAFIEKGGILFPLCKPIFSHGINNLKSALTGDLKIVRLDRVVGEAKGGKEVFLLVERVTKKNVKVRFYELDDQDHVVWEGWGVFNDLDVHHQYAIVCKTPKYRIQDITEPVNVFIELVRPSDDARSEPRQFRYIPNRDVRPGMKRRKFDYSSSFSSSDFSSNDLPATIDTIKAELARGQVQVNAPIYDDIHIPENLSEELRKALKNYNSAEFQQILERHSSDFSALFDNDAPRRVTDNKNYTVSRITNTQLPSLSHTLLMRQFATDSVYQTIKLEVRQEDKEKAGKFMVELKEFIKINKNNVERAQGFLTTHLGEEKVTNALHVLISTNKFSDVEIVIKILKHFNKLDLLQIGNDSGKTPLHLAVMCNNSKLVQVLLNCFALVRTADVDLNTPLHYAIKEGVGLDIVKYLVADRPREPASSYIDLKNTDGNTALFLAVEKGNRPAVILLHTRGANVNEIHPKNGFDPLRLAIENQHTDIVKYLLSLSNISYSTEDFNGVKPLSAAMQKDCPSEMKDVITQFMNEKGITVDVKQEESDSDDDTEEEPDIKPEPMDIDELEQLYAGVKTFEPNYLNQLSQILDDSNVWGSLAELLGFEHLISSGIIHDESMSKAVLKYATETNNDSVLEIRNFLESLDEVRAVRLIDKMVQESIHGR